MNDGLDTALLLPDVGEKPSKPYRSSPYTVREYAALPYAERVAVDAECDAAAGLIRTDYADESSPQPYTVGRATKRCSLGIFSTTPKAVLKSEHCPPSSTLQPPTPMPATYVHPAPSPALHTLNTPERIPHDTTHPDSQATFAVLAAAPRHAADLLDVVSRYVTLTEREDETDWTHWGTSPFLRGDTHSFAVNIGQNIFKCFTSGKTGDVVDFVMFMEELDEAEALAWLAAEFPNYYATPLEAAEPVQPSAAFAELAQATAEAVVPVAPAPTAPVAHNGTVYETTDYACFHLLPENREVDPKHVRKLVAMIQQSNLLHERPLVVTADMGVVDGQHRLAAARELSLPIFYKVGQQLSEADITTLNVAQKNWQGTDYLKNHTVKGKPAYVALTAFMQAHPTLSFSNAKMMLGETNKGHAEEFRAGHWKAGEIDQAEQVAVLVERIGAEVKTFKHSAHTGFVAALYHCVTRIPGFDSKELLRTILNQPLSLVPCASHKQWLDMLGRIYNYRKNAENHLRFE